MFVSCVSTASKNPKTPTQLPSQTTEEEGAGAGAWSSAAGRQLVEGIDEIELMLVGV
jgi:hypothetical protein